MMLGNTECNSDIAYFLKHGKLKPLNYKGTFVPPSINDEELYRQYQESNFNEYFEPARTYRFCLFK